MKKILLDVDGVVLDYQAGFLRFCAEKHPEIELNTNSFCFGLEEQKKGGIIESFNTSKDFMFLEPIDGAIEAINSAIKKGYQIIFLTSCYVDERTVTYRKRNLDWLGLDSNYEIHYTKVSHSKISLLSEFEPSFFADDILMHCNDAMNFGHHAHLILTNYNQEATQQSRVKVYASLKKAFTSFGIL